MNYPKEIENVIAKAKAVNRDELLKIFEQRIEDMSNCKYHTYRFCDFERERENQQKLLEKFDAGKKVAWLVSYDHFGYGTWGEDTITRLYTDGTWDVETHLAD